MGWRSVLRSSISVARHAANENAKAARWQAREQARVARMHAAELNGYFRDADALDHRIATDPIEACALRYVEGRGIVSTLTAGREAGVAAGYVPPRAPAPPAVLHEAAGCRLTLLDLRVAPFGVVAALGVEAMERVKMEVHRKADPKKSPLFLVDRASGSYLYPRATTIPGVVVASMPTVGSCERRGSASPIGARGSASP